MLRARVLWGLFQSANSHEDLLEIRLLISELIRAGVPHFSALESLLGGGGALTRSFRVMAAAVNCSANVFFCFMFSGLTVDCGKLRKSQESMSFGRCVRSQEHLESRRSTEESGQQFSNLGAVKSLPVLRIHPGIFSKLHSPTNQSSASIGLT